MWLALAAVLALRLWRLGQAGPPDYDSVDNWLTVRALAGGDGQVLFHHGAPGFTLLFVPIAWLTRDFRVFQVLHAVLAVGSLAVFAQFVRRAAELGAAATAAVVALAGTSLLLTFSGRDFVENGLSLGLASTLLASYFRRLHTHQPRALLRAAGWLALGLCFSFKLLFVVPVLAVLEWWAADGLLRRGGTWWRVAAVLAAPYVGLGAVGVAVGLPWFRWPAVYYRTIFLAAPNLAGNVDRVHLEPFFYLRYLLNFEPALLLGLLLALGVWRGRAHWRRGQPLALGPYLLVWAGCLLLGLSMLAKAPRALLFAYGPLAALLVLAGQRLLPGRALALLVLAALGFNGFVLWQQVYSRWPTRYPQVAAWLLAHHATYVATTVGLGLRPYLPDSVRVDVLNDERDLPALRRQGCQYVLLDSYWRVAQVRRFDSLRRQPPLAAWPEPLQTTPLLFLEHAEYTGLDYDATLREQQAAAADTAQLRLYKL